ncbi:MAG TPA: YceI family protein [Streptosporangiaceae bacterium]|nr:YceI family protein [Streptosporangiaceae bacterium]
MAVPAGHHRLGPDCGRLVLHTFRDGLAARAGHDLTIEVVGWSGELDVNADLTPARLELRFSMGSLAVRHGTGGALPITGRDRREIAFTARKTLAAERHPEASFSATEFRPGAGGGTGSGGGVVAGTLTLAGVTRPLQLQVAAAGDDRFHVTTSVTQSEFGIKPYAGFLGALKVRDEVDVEADIDLSGQAGGAA